MDKDLHYYGTYALARAAGLKAATARRIAMAAEFVDDSTDNEILVHPDGARFRGEATAHHPYDLAPNNDRDDQLLVWVPFHFLPGAEGATQSQRLICRKNSRLAQDMVKHHLDLADKTYGVELIGITAHVYADTFAHYGFSGVSSRVNRVAFETIKLGNYDPYQTKIERFFAKFGTQGSLLKNFRVNVMGEGAEKASGALGHGSVATCPDQPYLEWQYAYEMPDQAGTHNVIERQNAADYLEGAAALHAMFLEFAARRKSLADPSGPMDFDAIRPKLEALIKTKGSGDERIAAWKVAIADSSFSRKTDEPVPDYDHTAWRDQTQGLASLETPEAASEVPAYHFHHAAAMHRNFVLRELLPTNGIFVI